MARNDKDTSEKILEDYKPTPSVVRHVDATLKMMAVLTGDNRFEEAIPAVKEKGGNELTM